VATEKQRAAAGENVKKAEIGARSKRTLAHLPEATRTELAKQANKIKRAG
jgi:hypothetical protein